MRAKVYLSSQGAIAVKAAMVSSCGADKSITKGHGSLLAAKRRLQGTPIEDFAVREVTLPDWDGPLHERAAVACGLRRSSARFVERVEPL